MRLSSLKNKVVAVLLYGSQAKDSARPDSDIDIAILYEYSQIPDSLALWELKTSLEQTLVANVDLLCLNNADPIIGSQVYKYHQPVLINNSTQLAEYFAQMCSAYAELKELIKPMEDQILQRKYHVRSRDDH